MGNSCNRRKVCLCHYYGNFGNFRFSHHYKCVHQSIYNSLNVYIATPSTRLFGGIQTDDDDDDDDDADEEVIQSMRLKV
jgi:hypothetical protein